MELLTDSPGVPWLFMDLKFGNRHSDEIVSKKSLSKPRLVQFYWPITLINQFSMPKKICFIVNLMECRDSI